MSKFIDGYRALCGQLLESDLIDTGRWQSTDTSIKTYELLDTRIIYQMPATQLKLQRQIKPNLPWAEDHFQERVSGKPLNPPPSSDWWPYAVKDNQEHKEGVRKFEASATNWAYLAAMIDGDGSIVITPKGQVAIQIWQKDHDFIYRLAEMFPMGRVTTAVRRFKEDGVNRGKTAPAIWSVQRKSNARIILEGIRPYLILKRSKCDDALTSLDRLGITSHDKSGYVEKGPTRFSHTYPERYWPKGNNYEPRKGIRYAYGDLQDVVDLLKRDPLTRQAYLPVWSMEDTGVKEGQRVPCSIGYHFMIRDGGLSLWYQMRSCDAIRHFRDDVYMTVRLAQWVGAQLTGVVPDRLFMTISSFHAFEPDTSILERVASGGELP